MNGALLELLWRSLRGVLVRRARRLRQPRYLIAFLVSAGYFGFLVLPSFLRWSRRGGGGGPFGSAAGGFGGPPGAAAAGGADAVRLILMAAALLLALAVTLLWAFASSKPALRLSEADIDLLLPAPLTRRQVIELTLWRQQAGLLFGALVLTLFRGYGSPATRLQRLLASWALLTLVSLHAKGVSLWKARLRELPPAAARRRIALAVAAAGAWWAAVAATLYQALAQPSPPAGTLGLADLGAALDRLATAPPLALTLLLAPFRWLAAAFVLFGGPAGGAMAARGPWGGLAGRGPWPGSVGGSGWPGGAGAGGWLGGAGAGALGPLASTLFLAVLLVAHHEWVVRSRARFEDAAVERARRQVDRRFRRVALPPPAARARRRQPFRLAPTGLPEVAVYWKNLLIPNRRPLALRALQVLATGVLVWVAGTLLGAPLAFVSPVAGAGFLLLLLVPPFAGLNLRHDLRMDLLQLEVLRPWPLPGWRLVAAELLAPATTALSWTLTGYALLAGAVLAAGAGLDGLRQALPLPALGGAATRGSPAGAILAFGAALLIAGVPLALLSGAVQNVAALMLPGWVTLGPERRRGSGLAGQRLLIFAGQVVALLVGLLPAALLVAAALLVERWLGIPPAPWQAPPLALLAALPLLAEVGVLVRVGGAFWDRLDPSQELLAPEE